MVQGVFSTRHVECQVCVVCGVRRVWYQACVVSRIGGTQSTRSQNDPVKQLADEGIFYAPEACRAFTEICIVVPKAGIRNRNELSKF